MKIRKKLCGILSASEDWYYNYTAIKEHFAKWLWFHGHTHLWMKKPQKLKNKSYSNLSSLLNLSHLNQFTILRLRPQAISAILMSVKLQNQLNQSNGNGCIRYFVVYLKLLAHETTNLRRRENHWSKWWRYSYFNK